jgi:soluble cytochrome b562
METKSRYEVIADLETQKRKLIVERDSLNEILTRKQKELKDMLREVEDTKEDIANFEKTMEDKKETIKELISSVDASLQRLSQSQEKKR